VVVLQTPPLIRKELDEDEVGVVPAVRRREEDEEDEDEEDDEDED
jgi:hypothetical protein